MIINYVEVEWDFQENYWQVDEKILFDLPKDKRSSLISMIIIFIYRLKIMLSWISQIFIYAIAYYLFEEVQKETLQNDHTVIKLFNFNKSH